MEPIGYHYLVEASGCDPEILKDLDKIKEIMFNAAKIGKMDVKTVYFYKFSPSGVSGILVVSESHLSIHTWPENQYAAIDIFICGKGSEPEKALEFIISSVKSSYAHVTEVERGVKDEDIYTHSVISWDETYKNRI